MMRLILLLLAALPVFAQCTGYGSHIPAQFQAASGNIANYTAVISVTSKLLATVANGGLSQSAGFDICISDQINLVNFPLQIRSYTATTGALTAAVKVPGLAMAPTNVLVWIGKAGQSDPSTTAVWDANMLAVYPLQETCTPGGSTAGCFKDATSGARHSTGGVYPTQVSGVVGNAQSFAGAQTILMVNGLTTGTTSTISIWVKQAAHPVADAYIWQTLANASSQGTLLGIKTTGFGMAYVNNVEQDGAVDLSDNGWHLLTATQSVGPTAETLYVDGVLIGTASGTFNGFTSGNARIGCCFGNGAPGNWFTGSVQEARYSNIVRSAAWVKADYDSFHSPATFFQLLPRVWGFTQ